MSKITMLLFLGLILGGLPQCQNAKNEEVDTKEEERAQSKKAKGIKTEMLSKKDAAERLEAYAEGHSSDTVIIHTTLGDISVLLYRDTPMHRGNFLRLSERGYYDETYFHRVVPGFVMQGGGTDLFNKKIKIGNYRIPAEINTSKYIHKRGAVAMARYDEDNPNKESDSHEFYIVWGESFTSKTLDPYLKKYGLKLNDLQRSVYPVQGGSPHLDGLYTVFGEVISGMDVVEEVVHLEVDKRGWPLKNVNIKMEVIK